MAIDLVRGAVLWEPAADQVGVHEALLRVRDGRGGVALQGFAVTVAPPNTAPVIPSTPGSTAVVGLPFVYAVRAQDAEDDLLTFALTSPVPGPAKSVIWRGPCQRAMVADRRYGAANTP